MDFKDPKTQKLVLMGVGIGVPPQEGSVKISCRLVLRLAVLHENWVLCEPMPRCTPTVAP